MLFPAIAIFVASATGVVEAATAIEWAAPGTGPLEQTANYVGFSNDTLDDYVDIVPGVVFDRFVQIWFENTDFNTAASTSTFAKLAEQGLTFTKYHAVTHPSEPNYVAGLGGYHWGMHDDAFYHVPRNISTIVDLLEDKNISWATYQENMPSVAYYGDGFESHNYNDPNEDDYPYYARKHNPHIIYDSVVSVPERAARIRNLNDFANDITNGSLPQWIWVTPNMVNDAHDTTIDFAASWLEYWLVPLLEDERFNNEKTLILVTFDETENYDIQNNIFSVVVGGALPSELKGTTDSTFYTHYSSLSTVQANWGLGSLGRQDTNKTMSNVFSFVADATGYSNKDVPEAEQPLLNLTEIYAGPLNAEIYIPFWAPDTSVEGAGGGKVFVSPELDTTVTIDKLPSPEKVEISPFELPSDTTTLPEY
ncbi:hypothetical protein CYLTODRAFT_416625 [Cylindrobasidium torrendii FP15055 ss-10]|uniref:Acid phosphatase n=1 Tax=Cylindrobasidium torrendii FP15055 ss-10 TaxID=1314674 RepID=A0A0D7BWG1_9AGAR|nr:hypothetical protein CYLTODRAFT_416625 [Cylindrobasidium torrendii FP15055 ss-10]